jgi:hypothetical protein
MKKTLFKTYRYLGFIIFLLAWHSSDAQFYNGSQQDFGKNRVQYKSFDWLYYPSDYVDVYFYKGGKELAEFAVQSAGISQIEVEKLFDFTLQERVQIIVYNTQTDFRQSNLGIIDDNQGNIGGTTEIVGSKLFVYFDGDHGHFATQIREGIARVLFSQMMLGGNWKDVLRSSTFLSIPEWYKEGIISFAGEEWDSESNQYIRDGIKTGLYKSFNDIQGEQVKYSGHAMWKFIADVYGENVIPNILYMTKIGRNVEDGFLFVLGENLESISYKFVDYWETKFKQEEGSYAELKINRLYTDKQLGKIEVWEGIDAEKRKETVAKFDAVTPDEKSRSYRKLRTLVENWEILGYGGKKWRRLDKRFSKYLGAIPVKYKTKYTYSQFKRSPDEKYVSFVTHEYGQYKVWLYEIETGKLKRLIKKEHKIDRIQDLSYPNTTWHPNSEVLTFITEKRGRVYLNNYTVTDKKTVEKELFRIEKVIDLSYSADGKKIVFSGVALGQTDLYMYYVIGNSQTRLTNDIYDDLHPSFLPGSETIIFSSNRPDDTLRTDVPVDVYSNIKDIYLFYPGDNPSLEQVTRTPEFDEDQPEALSDKYFSYLSFRKNFKNQYAASVDSAISRIDTTIHYRYFTKETILSNYSFQLDNYQIHSESKTFNYSFYKEGRQQFNWGKLEDGKTVTDLGKSALEVGDISGSEKGVGELQIILIDNSDREVDPLNYEFSASGGNVEIEKEIVRIQDMLDSSDSSTTAEKKFELPKSRNYRLNFVIDEVTTQLDNSLGFQMYQSLSANTNLNQGSGIGGMARVSDLFEDHKLKGVVRLSASNSGIEGGVFYQNLKKRLDKEYSVQRFSNQAVLPNLPWITESQMLMGAYKLTYPLDEVRSIRGTAIALLDDIKVYATEINNASIENDRDIMAGLRLAYVYDNTRSRGFNLLEGTRYKVFAEYYQEPTKENSGMQVVGLDFRHYTHIYRNLTVAVRGAGSTSFGDRKILNVLGGVDSELLAKQGDAEIAQDQGYYYLSQSSPMRGFFQNSRNGNNFAVINSEVRWPLFKFFSKKPLNSEFTKTFMFTLFSDVGSAWNGFNPYSEENQFNQVISAGNPVLVSIQNNREPVVWSYGFGARAKILGYFVRADYGWGVDDGQILDGVLHLSLNMDF